MKSRSRKDDAVARILRANGNRQELDKILQEECRRRASKKLAATLVSAPGFRFPTRLSAEQASADEVAGFHASVIPEGKRVVDLTAGLGIDAFHLAAKSCEVTAVEINPTVAEAIKHNAVALGLTNVTAVNADCSRWLTEQAPGSFDIAFIDPARRGADGSRLYSFKQCAPDVVELLVDISRIAKRLLIKASPMLDIYQCLRELTEVTDVYAVGTKAECKELLFDLTFGSNSEPKIHAVTVGTDNDAVIITKTGEHTKYAATVAPGDIIGEPWPAVMKIQPKGFIDAEQLHPSTFLFKNPGPDFPGAIYKVTRVEPFSSSNLRRLAKEGISASVASRNFPLGADDLRKRLKARESSECRLIATTLASGEQILMFLRAIHEKNS